MKKTKPPLLTIHPLVQLRTPQFPLGAKLQDFWEELKISISIASKEFHELIKDLDYDQLQYAPDHIQYTVLKYFNRAQYRATPFGSFAGVGLVDFIPRKNDDTVIKIATNQQLHQFREWSAINTVDPIGNDLESLKFFSNSSYYVFQDSTRYLSRFNNEHQVSEIVSNPVISELLKLCNTPASYQTIMATLRGQFNKKSIDGLLKDLIAAQLLYTSKQPNIIGENDFISLNSPDVTLSKNYIIAERKVMGGGLHPSHFRHLPELIDRLSRIIVPTKLPALDDFISKFIRKFGEEAVPIMQALDPELGIGYGQLEQFSIEKDLNLSSSGQSRDLPQGTERLKSNLLKQLLANQSACPATINLEDLVQENAPKVPRLPNSLTVLASPAKDMLQIDSIGGVTANAILGRFSLCGHTYKNMCREIANLEQNANPDVLFFDIGYAADPRTDNINRRSPIYEQQLTLLNYDSSTTPLRLNDIFMLVRGNELLLYSHKFKKRLLPRMSSAYNYSRSDLAVFRLLCDLQHQGLQTDLNLNLHDCYPDLAYYPRLSFKNLIISPAQWKINQQDVKGKTICVQSIREYLDGLGVSRLFKSGDTDQTLCFDQQNEDDLHTFCNYLKKQKHFYVKEAWTSGFAQDVSGFSFHNQLVLTMTHQIKLYDRLDLDTETQHKPQQTSCFPPGSKWLYFQIYCPPSRANDFLLAVIRPLLLEFAQEIEKWFFIRYEENGHHIRLRFCLKNTNTAKQLNARLSAMLAPYFASGILSDFSIGTYRQEIQRYGADLMEQVELHFCADSQLVLSLTSIPMETFGKYRLCLRIFELVKNAGLFSLTEFDELIQSNSAAFNSEYQLVPADYKQLNSTYKEFLQIGCPALNLEQVTLFEFYGESLLHTLNNCAIKRRHQLFSDLLHMHINRLFPDQQRKHEMIIYYLFSRTLKRET